MSVYDMEYFTSLVELGGWEPDNLTNQSDDLGPRQDLYSGIEDVKPSRMEGVFHDVLDPLVSEHSDPFSEDWLEQTNLGQMLEELTGMAMDNNPVPVSVAALKEEPVPISEYVDDSVFADLGLDKDGFELLQQLVEKASELDSSLFKSPDNTLSLVASMDISPEVDPVISLDDSGIASLDSSLLESSVCTIDLSDVDNAYLSPLSVSEAESVFSSAPVSPSSSISNSDCSTSELYKIMTQPSNTYVASRKSSPYSVQSTSSGCKSKLKCVSTDSLQIEFLGKKEKKKLQNKNAAIRYRQKKKVEADETKLEEDELEENNKNLNDKVEELQREIQYMKNLMCDVYKARGHVKITKVTVSC